MVFFLSFCLGGMGLGGRGEGEGAQISALKALSPSPPSFPSPPFLPLTSLPPAPMISESGVNPEASAKKMNIFDEGRLEESDCELLQTIYRELGSELGRGSESRCFLGCPVRRG